MIIKIKIIITTIIIIVKVAIIKFITLVISNNSK